MVKTMNRVNAMANNSNVQFTGLEGLDIDNEQQDVLHFLASKYIQKMNQRTHYNNGSLDILIKEREKDGAQHRYEVKSFFSCPSTSISAEASGWDVLKSLKETLLAIDGQLVKLHAKPKRTMTPFMNMITSTDKLDKALRVVGNTKEYIRT